MEINKTVDIDTCKKRLQEKFNISFQDIEISFCKADIMYNENALYAEMTINNQFFNKISNKFNLNTDVLDLLVDHPHSLNIPQIIPNANLFYEYIVFYHPNKGFSNKIIGCNSEMLHCSFFYSEHGG
ncbi:MAG: hypothetical protein QM487_14500 [Candidatus Marithrix sp.]